MVTQEAITKNENEQVYHRAIARMEKDLGWAPSKAHDAIAEAASAYGVFLDDVAHAVLAARSIKRGLTHVLRQTDFDRRPPPMRHLPAQ